MRRADRRLPRLWPTSGVRPRQPTPVMAHHRGSGPCCGTSPGLVQARVTPAMCHGCGSCGVRVGRRGGHRPVLAEPVRAGRSGRVPVLALGRGHACTPAPAPMSGPAAHHDPSLGPKLSSGRPGERLGPACRQDYSLGPKLSNGEALVIIGTPARRNPAHSERAAPMAHHPGFGPGRIAVPSSG